jgi:copper(I)-binding protein
MRKLLIAMLAIIALVSPAAIAQISSAASAAEQAPAPVVAGDLTITAYRAKAMLPGQPTGGAFLTIANKGSVADRLLSITSPSAGMVEVHTMEVVNDVMTMRPLEDGLEIAPGATVELKPGGTHLMFMQVKEPFKKGGEVPVTLEFEKAGKVEIDFPVVGLGG